MLRPEYEHWLHADAEINKILDEGREEVLPIAERKVAHVKEVMGIPNRIE